ncbi:MAG: alkaline phosphatase family protein [Verrucomicrobia bacterium]|nr:alkaline phosphatase family protein [Verrucomicrobiota bacterium]MDA1005883.1 alkaline phosphatase family protein [Verrucomicrobiota bacterium]
MKRLAVLNVVGLSRGLLGEDTPNLVKFAEGRDTVVFPPAFPAVTCTAQSSYLTGTSPTQHGIVGNGWYDREAAEVKFWKQSNHLVRGEKIWERLRRERPGFTCAKMFWWYNMYSSADWSVTPRPMYPADGRKVFDVYTQPMEMREALKAELGEFPFPSFWGPRSGIESSEWIAASARWVEEKHGPDLNLVYLPHLDYVLQKCGPGSGEAREELREELRAIDTLVGEQIAFYEARGVEVVVLSEYGISPVRKPVHLNRVLRKAGWITIKEELGLETLDCGASKVFAVADHQVAHVYVNDVTLKEEVRRVLEATEGVAEVREGCFGEEIGAERGGDFVVVSEADAWFTYYFWEDDAVAPDYARCIDIHRKPGYDPVELFIDPELKCPQWKVAKFLLKKKLGFRGLLDVIPLDATLVKGSHGRDEVPEDEQPLVIGRLPRMPERAEEVFDAIASFYE